MWNSRPTGMHSDEAHTVSSTSDAPSVFRVFQKSGHLAGRAIWLLVLLVLAGLAIPAVVSFLIAGTVEARKVSRYHCPMHPTVVSDRPGSCPICGMRLVPIDEEESSPTSGHEDHAGHGEPEQVPKGEAHPATTTSGDGAVSAGRMPEGMAGMPAAGDQGVDGRIPVRLSERKRQLIGVRTEPVVRRRLERTIRTVGRVTYDETRLHHVHTKVAGWIERLYANATGEMVQANRPLFTFYSPELVASAQEYLLALEARRRLSDTTLPSVRDSGERLLASARRRLQLFDLTADQIRELERRGTVPTTMTVYAPISGHIISRNITQGEKIEAGTNLLDIADLSHVWVLADIYEYELPFVHVGQPATMTLSYLPDRTFEGKVTLVYPTVSEATRTVKVRIEFANPDYMLRPEMYAQVEIRSNLGEALVVPESAVISTGTRDIAFVDRGNGILEPRELTLGVRLPDVFAVTSGLSEGEQVVTSGNFLIDSESKLKAALSQSEERE